MNYTMENSRGLIRLNNMGNSCYLNSVLQVLLNTPLFRIHFLNKKYSIDLINTIKKTIDCNSEFLDVSKIASILPNYLSFQFDKLCGQIWTIDLDNPFNINCITPNVIKKIISKRFNDFNNYMQQDAQEFFTAFLDVINSEISFFVKMDFNFTDEETSFIDTLNMHLNELTNLNGIDKINKYEHIRFLEEYNTPILKKYKQYKTLSFKHKDKYSICDELFSFGCINTLECSKCGYKSYIYEDNVFLFAEFPDIVVPDIDDIAEVIDNSPLMLNDIVVEEETLMQDDAGFLLDSDDEVSPCRGDTTSFLRNDEKKEKEEIKINIDKYFNQSKIDYQYTLDECLDKTFRKEILDIKRYCNYCNDNIDTYKMYSIFNLPKYLFIQLKRFKNDYKIQNLVKFEETLDLNKYIDIDLSDNLKAETKYKLINIINHSGRTLNEGHYYSYCNIAEHNRWFEMNDSRINFCDNVHTNNAYILCYEKM